MVFYGALCHRQRPDSTDNHLILLTFLTLHRQLYETRCLPRHWRCFLKYYCLFQHHIPPPKVSFTSPTTRQKQSILPEHQSEDSSFIIGECPGPYPSEHSRSLYSCLSTTLAFLGVDGRTERTRRRVNYPDTFDVIFQGVRSELSGGKCKITHLVVLLEMPITYPRFVWLEKFVEISSDRPYPLSQQAL